MSTLGEFLPMQLIYTWPIDLCHSKVKFPSGFDIIHSRNHWSNEELVISLLEKILIASIQKKCEALKLGEDTKALLIFIVLKGQTFGAVKKLLEDSHCVVQQMLNNHTNLF